MLRKFFAEALGTCLLLFGVGTATLTFGFHARQPTISIAASIVTIALAFGLMLLVLAYAIGPISGCHINPAVTLGMLLTRRMPPREAGEFRVAQFAGGIIGSLLLWAVAAQIPGYSTSRQGLGINGWGVGGTALSQVWLFIVPPLAGAAVAAGLHYVLNTDAAEASAAQDAQLRVPRTGSRPARAPPTLRAEGAW